MRSRYCQACGTVTLELLGAGVCQDCWFKQCERDEEEADAEWGDILSGSDEGDDDKEYDPWG